ncbi:protein-L-isoaspartate(D-aspartate) O-methyltransferase [Paraflavitalea pollutisoli]|uniref:protein-L-isoaspartate(D-aspartate) O-methyltransferase n=1 Tax=Paraflavitalea pollutisoli TaxID=3034143 RepID=UPI0023EE1BB5|nr:protein-L-isoaspartate(D-aspartate) O-methyltransferase [Paraflavitalea sp. H1-2-19X]
MRGSDTKRQREKRQRLVDLLRKQGITDERLLDALNTVARHAFMPPELVDRAYENRAFPIGEDQTISQPFTVAYMTALLHVQPGDKILEVGTGSAYQAVLLAELGAIVHSIERQRKLYDRYKDFELLKRYPNLHCYYGDGYAGLPHEAPFDSILLTAAPPGIPVELGHQLKNGGVLVAPVGPAGMQRMLRLTKNVDGALTEEVFDKFSFVPMLPGKQ